MWNFKGNYSTKKELGNKQIVKLEKVPDFEGGTGILTFAC